VEKGGRRKSPEQPGQMTKARKEAAGKARRLVCSHPVEWKKKDKKDNEGFGLP
jgi:hypothetical protein